MLGCGGGEGRGMGVWRKVRGEVRGVKKCERAYGVSVGKCVGVWGEIREDVGRDLEVWVEVCWGFPYSVL